MATCLVNVVGGGLVYGLSKRKGEDDDDGT